MRSNRSPSMQLPGLPGRAIVSSVAVPDIGLPDVAIRTPNEVVGMDRHTGAACENRSCSGVTPRLRGESWTNSGVPRASPAGGEVPEFLRYLHPCRASFPF